MTTTTSASTTELSHGYLRILFGLMGVGILLPYSALISCDDFYMILHSETHDIAGRLTALNLSALLVATVVLMPLTEGAKTCLSSPIFRSMTGLVSIFIFLVLLSLVRYPSVTLLAVAAFAFGVTDAISQSGIFVLANEYASPAYPAAATIGTAVTGMSVSLLRLATRAMFPTDTIEGLAKSCSLLYGLVAAIMIVCIGAVQVVARDRYRLQKLQFAQENEDQQESGDDGREERCKSSTLEEAVDHSHRSTVSRKCDAATGRTMQAMDIDTVLHEVPHKWYHGVTRHPRLANYFAALRYTWKPTLSTFFNFFVTLCLFPGVVASIQSIESTHAAFGDWITVVLIAVFNVADFAGRVIVGTDRVTHFLLHQHQDISYRGEEHVTSPIHQEPRQFPNYNRVVWSMTWVRVLFFPLVILCVYPSHGNPLIANDIVRSTIVFVMGLSNGFIICSNFVVVPSMSPASYQDAAQLLNLLALFAGLTSGSYFGLGLNAILEMIAS